LKRLIAAVAPVVAKKAGQISIHSNLIACKMLLFDHLNPHEDVCLHIFNQVKDTVVVGAQSP
jgi:hypothetical protein